MKSVVGLGRTDRAVRPKFRALCMGIALVGTAWAGSACAAPAVQVVIENYAFTPANLTVAKGTTVEWVNHDTVPHTVAADQPHFESAPLDTDETFSKTFNEPGEYTYVCTQHGRMSGTVTVKP